MNKIKLTVALFSAFSLMIFSSFNIEPLNSDLLRNVINPDSLEGTYRMIAFNTGIPTDLNNGSFTATSKGVDVNAFATLKGYTNPDIMGTWVFNVTELTLQFVEVSVQNAELFSVSVNSLT